LVLERRFRVFGLSKRPNTDGEILASQHFGDYEMRKTQLALAAVALVASTAAMATNVTISGNLDMGIARTSGYNGTGGMFLEQGAYFDNNSISLSVKEDLGSGLKAHGSLGMGFNANGQSDNPGSCRDANSALTSSFNGPLCNQLFNRQSYVGLSGEFGDIRIGRQLSPFIAAAAGNMHYVGMFGVGRLGMAGDGGPAAGVAAGSTAGGFFRDDAIQYTTPSMSGFTGTAMLTMRNSTTNNQYVIDRGRYSAFSLSGPLGPITVNAAYHKQAYTANLAGEYTGYAVGGMAPITDGISLSAGFISTRAGGVNQDRTDSWNAGIGFDISGSTKLQAQYASSNARANESTTLANLMLINSVSARTKLYAALGFGNRVGATIGTLGAVDANGAAVTNGPFLNNVANAAGTAATNNIATNGAANGSNNAIVFGVAHSF